VDYTRAMTDAQLAGAMMLVSGAAHAIVNAILKSGKDKMSSRALIDGFSALLVLPAAFVFPLPVGAWTWLGLSWLTHLAYLVCLVRAFERADMSVAYPILRGVAPALTAIVLVSTGETISFAVAIGIALVSSGVMLIGLERRVDREALVWALATGTTIALYTVIDAAGVRAAPTAGSYIVWVYLTLGAGIGMLFAIWRGPAFVVAARSEWKAGLTAGALSIVTYGLALYAYRIGQTPALAALRETSIVVGTAIAVFVLGEKLSRTRIFGIGAIVAGAILLLGAS
jgi:drug/metabolite transporter (DMT)-like permease